MSDKYSFRLPLSLNDVTLDQYQRYSKLVSEHRDDASDEFLKIKLLEIFGGITNKQALELVAADVDDIIAVILEALNEEPKMQRRFTMTDPKGKTVEFGFVTNLEKLTLGEFIDAEAYITDFDTMHKAMAVLYRPITGSKGEFYEIEKYETSEKYAEVMKDAPASVAVGAMVFFYRLGMTLHNVTLHSLAHQVEQTSKEGQQQTLKPSLKNGDGINQFTLLLEEMYSELAKLPIGSFTNVYSGLNLKKKKAS